MEFSENTVNLMDVFMKEFEDKFFNLKTQKERVIFDRITQKCMLI